MEILHFPARSYSQFSRKIIIGGAAYERNRNLPKTSGFDWRRFYKKYKDGELEEYYDYQSLAAEEMHSALKDGTIVKDVRLRDYSEAVLSVQKELG